MRELQECRAEVFRRSENRIKARKKRTKRILLTCIPMVLGITVLTAALWPKDGGSPSFVGVAENATCAQASGAVSGSTNSSGARVEVTGENISLSYVEAADVLKITDYLNSLTAEEPEAAPEDLYEAPSDRESPESMPQAPGENQAPSSGQGQDTAESGHKHSVTDGILDNDSVTLSERVTITVTEENGVQTRYSLEANTLTDLTSDEVYVLTTEQTEELKTLLGMSRP